MRQKNLTRQFHQDAKIYIWNDGEMPEYNIGASGIPYLDGAPMSGCNFYIYKMAALLYFCRSAVIFQVAF